MKIDFSKSSQMTIPQFLKLCSMLTAQRFVAERLNTQGHVIRGWADEKVECRRTPADFEHLRKVIIALYEEFPMVVDMLMKIKIVKAERRPPVERVSRIIRLSRKLDRNAHLNSRTRRI